jgi:alpha-tubulin suppressor-like RCC1 family protein
MRRFGAAVAVWSVLATLVGGTPATAAVAAVQSTPLTWGDNGSGQLGIGTTTNSSTPVQVTGLSGVTAIASGLFHILAVRSDGTVWAWGYNSDGQLGNGTCCVASSTPQRVISLSGITAVTGGANHSLALKSHGTVWAWGSNGYGQLGNGSTTDSFTPMQVKGLRGVTAIAGGFVYSLALKSDGTVWAWGDNNSGQLGNGTRTMSSTPVQVSGLGGVTAIAAAGNHSLALKSDGTVWSWGYNGYGQLGNGTTTDSSTPVAVSGLSRVTAIAGGAWHSLALKSDGTVWGWGDNYDGQIGNGTNVDVNPAPVQVSGLSGATAIGSGWYHSLALTSHGTVWAWGANGRGQLGNGTTTPSSTPVEVSGLSSMTAIAGGYANSVAVAACQGKHGRHEHDQPNTRCAEADQGGGFLGARVARDAESH